MEIFLSLFSYPGFLFRCYSHPGTSKNLINHLVGWAFSCPVHIEGGRGCPPLSYNFGCFIIWNSLRDNSKNFIAKIFGAQSLLLFLTSAKVNFLNRQRSLCLKQFLLHPHSFYVGQNLATHCPSASRLRRRRLLHQNHR